MEDHRPCEDRAAGIRAAVREKYRDVPAEPRGKFPYPVGRESAIGLGYNPAWLDAIPPEIVSRFVGVGNPYRIRAPRRGEHVLDIGCGCGLDTFVAAELVGPEGHVAGVDSTPEMLDVPRRILRRSPDRPIALFEAYAEALPFRDGSFDQVISNGVLNLAPNKDAAFAEIARVLRRGGVFAAADLLVIDTIPEETLADLDAWST